MDDIGVNIPPINTNINTMKNMRNMLCDIVAELFAIIIPIPDITKTNIIAAEYMAINEPVGTNPYANAAIAMAAVRRVVL